MRLSLAAVFVICGALLSACGGPSSSLVSGGGAASPDQPSRLTSRQSNAFTPPPPPPASPPGATPFVSFAPPPPSSLRSTTSLTPQAQSSTPAFFSGQVALSNGVYYLALPNGNIFGYYSYLTNPQYIYHFDLGYEYIVDAADGKGGLYMYDFASARWLYTGTQYSFPYMYDLSLFESLYYYPDTKNVGHYSTNPRYFYDFTTTSIVTLPALTGTWSAVYQNSTGISKQLTGSLPMIAVPDLGNYSGASVTIAANALGNVVISNNTCPTSFSISANGTNVNLSPNLSATTCTFTVTDSISNKLVKVTYLGPIFLQAR